MEGSDAPIGPCRGARPAGMLVKSRNAGQNAAQQSKGHAKSEPQEGWKCAMLRSRYDARHAPASPRPSWDMLNRQARTSSCNVTTSPKHAPAAPSMHQLMQRIQNATNCCKRAPASPPRPSWDMLDRHARTSSCNVTTSQKRAPASPPRPS